MVAKKDKAAAAAEDAKVEEREPDRVAMFTLDAEGNPLPGQVLIDE